ncbi:MAG TPA: alpha/beta hydrolase [Gaiellaceae bacterium]|nr:alpha/beta hydrolase [Gaiellaceae bacterium]
MPGGPQAILLPGSVLPAGLAYGALVEALGDEADARPKELEVYANDVPPAGYSLELEIEGVLREAEAAGLERFHLVGYSGGGAAALALAARRPNRLLSLALLEPAWIGWSGMGPEEHAVWETFDALVSADPDELMPAFVRFQLRPGVEPPPPPEGPPPPWMASRPAGIRAFANVFRTGDIDHEALRQFRRPVYYALGGRSNPVLYERAAMRLERLFLDFTLEIFRERHHFDPPHRIEPERLAASLLEHWHRAEESS